MQEYADPWNDIQVIDKRAVRLSQGIVALFTLLGIMFSPWFYFLIALQLFFSLRLGRRFCLACLLYYHFVQPRFGQGQLEDSRAPRFANTIGMSLLFLAFLFAFFPPVSYALAITVFLLASLAASSGFCLGCAIYRLFAHFRGVRDWQGERVDPDDFQGPGEILFWHPLCSQCQEWKERLPKAQLVDVSKNKDLADKYGIRIVPTAYQIDKRGLISKQLAP